MLLKIFLLVYLQQQIIASRTFLNISTSTATGYKIHRFWTSTGFSPTPSGITRRDFFLSDDEYYNLDLIGSIPNQGLTHIRIHWLLDLVKASCHNSTIKWKYDFSDLDKFLHRLTRNELSVGFELMGNPSNCFTDWKQQNKEWNYFISLLLKHLTETFGQSQLNEWRFETFNEPDLAMFNEYKMNLKDYLQYLEATSRTLAKFNFTLWGPAGLFKNHENHPICWGTLDYCSERKKCPINVVSFHKKGDAVASQVVNRGEDLIRKIQMSFPRLKNALFANDEADPLVGWIKSERWQSDVRYAAAVVQTVIGSLHSSRSLSYNLAAISNDNAFLSYFPNFWTQRTLLARFQMNNTSPPHTQMFRKPVFQAMQMLSLLNGEMLSISYNPGNPGYSYISADDSGRIVLIMVVNDDNLTNTSLTDKMEHEVRLNIRLKCNVSYKAAVQILENRWSNPEKVWRRLGSSNFPDRLMRRKIRRHEQPRQKLFNVKEGTRNFVWQVKLFIPSVLSVNLCPEKSPTPGRVNRLRFRKINHNEILLLWSDSDIKSRCLQTYIVEFRTIDGTTFQAINAGHISTKAFHFDGCRKKIKGDCQDPEIEGFYRVVAKDVWGRLGDYSNVIKVIFRS